MSDQIFPGGTPQTAPTEQMFTQAAFTAPNIYATGYANAMNGVDVTTVLIWNQRPAALVSMSLSTAKTYAKALATLVADAEQKLGYTVPLLDEIVEKIGLENRPTRT